MPSPSPSAATGRSSSSAESHPRGRQVRLPLPLELDGRSDCTIARRYYGNTRGYLDDQLDIIIETGVARGVGPVHGIIARADRKRAQIIGVDIDIRPHNRDAVERHPMSKRVTLIEGASTDPAVVAKGARGDPERSGRDGTVGFPTTAATMCLPNCAATDPWSRPAAISSWPTYVAPLLRKRPRAIARSCHKGNDPLTALAHYLEETDRFEVDPVLNGKLILSSSPGGYVRCRRGR